MTKAKAKATIPPLVVDEAARELANAGIPAARREAEALAIHAEVSGGPDPAAAYALLVARRAARVPLEHLTGRVRFRAIELLVGPGVFVPQPETGPVVQWAVDAMQARFTGGTPLCVDLCTGSGTVGLSLAAEIPNAVVHAVELDPGALEWAARNVAHNGLRVTLHAADAATALPELDGLVDLVASNPPYVSTRELDGVAPEVRDHDPAVSLEAGHDGLDLIRIVEATARRLLRAGGLVVVEHSDRQGATAPAVFASAGGWSDIRDHRDADGLDRFVTATRSL
jgi:release factor glutamine methyltransferase